MPNGRTIPQGSRSITGRERRQWFSAQQKLEARVRDLEPLFDRKALEVEVLKKAAAAARERTGLAVAGPGSIRHLPEHLTAHIAADEAGWFGAE
jgi:hypothetical protein